MKKYALAIAALLTLGTAQTATAEVSVGISIGIPGIIYSGPGYWYEPPPPPRAYYRPPAIVIAPTPRYHRWYGGHVERARYDRHKHYRGHRGKHKGHRGHGKHHHGHHR
ncbi:MAG: virulence factor [Alcaligenaceae bacterium]|nr:virulence factor [Alcaligenaceae bacterium]